MACCFSEPSHTQDIVIVNASDASDTRRETHRHRHTRRETYTHRHTDRETDRDSETEGDRHTALNKSSAAQCNVAHDCACSPHAHVCLHRHVRSQVCQFMCQKRKLSVHVSEEESVATGCLCVLVPFPPLSSRRCEVDKYYLKEYSFFPNALCGHLPILTKHPKKPFSQREFSFLEDIQIILQVVQKSTVEQIVVPVGDSTCASAAHPRTNFGAGCKFPFATDHGRNSIFHVRIRIVP